MPVFVIGLERLKEQRYQRVLNDLARIGVDASVWRAVDGLKPIKYEPGEAVARFQPKFYAIHGRPLFRGEIGCYLSHWRLWKHAFVEKGFERIVVLEDDAIFDAARFKEALTNIAKLDQAFEYIKLEQDYFSPNKARVNAKGPALAKDGCALYTPGGWHMSGAYCYALSRRGFEKLAPALTPIKEPIDKVAMFNYRKTALRTWLAHPSLCRVDLKAPSAIHNWRNAKEQAQMRRSAYVRFALAPLRWFYLARIISEWMSLQQGAAGRFAYARTLLALAGEDVWFVLTLMRVRRLVYRFLRGGYGVIEFETRRREVGLSV